MMELFDMGKYDFYVWTSIGIFIVAILADALNINSQRKQITRAIQSTAKKNRNKTNRSNAT